MPSKTDPPTFADRLRAARDRAGLSQAQLARAAGVGDRTVASIEQGINQPSWETACKLAAALGISTEVFRAR